MRKVVCVGDSIRMGYEPTVVVELQGWAQVAENGVHFTPAGSAILGHAAARRNPRCKGGVR